LAEFAFRFRHTILSELLPMLFTRLVTKSTNLDRVKQKFSRRFCGNFADGIKKGVKDVMDADERRNKIKYVSTACLAGIRPSLRHSV
jgi:hypothetical protein